MRSITRTWAPVLLLTLAAVIAAVSIRRVPAQPPAAPSSTASPTTRPRWQYASLLTSVRLSKWTTPDADKIEDGDHGYVRLYQDLGGTKPPDQVTLLDVMNVIGDQGWELTAIDGGEGPHQYLFKRPAD